MKVLTLRKNNITRNSALRNKAKLMLNGIYGKFSQRPYLPKTTVASDYSEYWKIVGNDEFKVLGEYEIINETVLVSHEMKNILDCDPGNKSVAISAFVTSYARLHLYSFMKVIVPNGEDRLLYFGTDSVFYITRMGDTPLLTGDYLGELTDEIKQDYGEHAKCLKFVSCGPKNYGYEVLIDGERKAVIKSKGIQQNAKTINLVNIERMVELVNKYIKGNSKEINVAQWRIGSDKISHQVNSLDYFKKYRCISDKRRIIGNGTVPYGYVVNLLTNKVQYV